MVDQSSQVQELALRLFLGLRMYRSIWRGTLLLGIGLDMEGRSFALASLAAGAAGLFLEQDGSCLRDAQRQGCVTFTVTSLAEAVRILKNDIRRGTPVAVALRSSPCDALAEMVERGLQPVALLSGNTATPQVLALCQVLLDRGALRLRSHGNDTIGGEVNLQASANAALGAQWLVCEDVVTSYQLRRAQDRDLMTRTEQRCGTSRVADAAADWLRVIPALQPRGLARFFLQENESHTVQGQPGAG